MNQERRKKNKKGLIWKPGTQEESLRLNLEARKPRRRIESAKAESRKAFKAEK
jgi:hypothetical protein